MRKKMPFHVSIFMSYATSANNPEFARDGNTLTLQGAVTIDNAAALMQQGNVLLQAVGEDAVMDLAQVTAVDSAAVSLLLEWQRNAASRRQKIAYVNLPQNLVSLARLYDVAELIPLPS